MQYAKASVLEQFKGPIAPDPTGFLAVDAFVEDKSFP
jgi:hypothetical protein